MELYAPLDPLYIPQVWRSSQQYLAQEIRGSNPKLEILEGFELFINSKGTKDKLFADSLTNVLPLYKDKVQSLQSESDRQIESCFNSRKIDSNRFWIDVGIII